MSADGPASICSAIQKAQHILRLEMDAALREPGLTAPQFAALAALAREPGLSGARLARRCLVTPQTMTGILNNLAASDLIIRTPDPEHGRIIQARLTPKGTQIFASANATVARLEERMASDLDRAERDALVDLLNQCAQTLASR